MLQIKEQSFSMTEANKMHIKTHFDRLSDRLKDFRLDKTVCVSVRREGPDYVVVSRLNEDLQSVAKDKDFYKSVTKAFDKLERIIVEKHQKIQNNRRRKQRKTSLDEKIKEEVVLDDIESQN